MSAEVRELRRGGEAVADVPRYWFRPSHRSLVKPAVRSAADLVDVSRAPCDAVLVPSHLHPERLGTAADLAARLACVLIVVCTTGRQTSIASPLRRRLRQLRTTWVLAFDWPAPMPLRGLLTPREAGATSVKHKDVAAKRNTGLALARMLGWRRMLFLDDDVRGLSASSVRAACRRLGDAGRQAVSWHLCRFEDNSVVCHARRLSGREQDTFIGGGALAVDVTSQLPIFPPVYNEDWLFLHQLLGAGAVEAGGDVRQLRFDPFGLPERAKDEEFGDILAEGVFHLLHEEATIGVAEHSAYWGDVVEIRRAVISEVSRSLRARLLHPPGIFTGRGARSVTERALVSLDVAAAVHSREDLPKHLASFVRAWRADLRRWHAWYGGLPRVDDVEDALRFLGMANWSLTIVDGL
jgi:hypothetical protein